MASPLRNSLIIASLLVVSMPLLVFSDPLNLSVVYPKNDQMLPAVDSTFIFGSVDPQATLTINGHNVTIHEGGGWLAFLPVNPGQFKFELSAEKDDQVDSLTIEVELPPLNAYSFDSLYFVPGSFKPSVPLKVLPGDEITVSFKSVPYCNAFCVVEPFGDTIIMREIGPVSYYGDTSVFGQSSDEITRPGDSLVRRGIYRGSYRFGSRATDSIHLIYYVYPPSIHQLMWLNLNQPDKISEILTLHRIGHWPPILAETSTVAIEVLDQSLPEIVEFKDSLTIIRSGPRKGYLCIHQPAGIRAPLMGQNGDWLKIRLGQNRTGWVSKDAVNILPLGTEIPHSYVTRINTENHENKVSIKVPLSTRHPFRVIENVIEKSIVVYIFGADSDTDWIRYDNSDSLINHIVWFQEEPQVFGFKIYLNDDHIWGYDGYYLGNEFNFDLKKQNRDALSFSDLRITIDAGHSPDPGAIGPTRLTEKEANLHIAIQLKKELERLGAKVIMTRDDDSPLPLYDRPKIAIREKADIFISIHNNALPDGVNPFENNGVSTYYYHPHSMALARAVQNSLVRNIDLPDYGFYHGNLAVNRPTQFPAILVETAFIMIPEQEALLKKPAFHKKAARAIVEGVADFLRGKALSDWDIRQNQSYGRD